MTVATLSHTRVHPLLPTVGADQRVPLVTGHTTRFVNLDVAASAPALSAVNDRVQQALAWYSSVHRGAGYLSQVSTSAYESARESVRDFVGGRPEDVVVFTRNTTDSLNLLAGAVPAGAAVLVLDIEHHANLLPWRRSRLTTLPAAPTLAGTLASIEAELSRVRYALLAVTGLSNVTGESLPIRQLAALAHRHGARIAVDGAQLVPHHRVSVADLGVDYLAFSGHKLYAPFGAGVLIGRRDWLDAAPPYLSGGGAVREVSTGEVEWAASPERHEAGSPNVLGALALGAACHALAALDSPAVAEHERGLYRQLVDGLAGIEGLRVCRIWPDSEDPTGIVTFTIEGYPPSLIASVLSAEHGIGVRDGRFCAHPLLARLKLADGAVRVSLGLHSRSSDVDRLVAALTALRANGPGWSYRNHNGRYLAAADPRRLPEFLGGGRLDSTEGAGSAPCQPAADQR